MQKAFDPQSFESRLYQQWESAGCFVAQDRSEKPPFCIVIPPPNVTGALHNGHALFLTIQDVLIRWKRMAGFNTLWLPGTDHAGIATQMVVERDLAKEGKNRHQLGRTAFVERVWQWKEKHGGLITKQMRVMGASVDWKRERFTMDEGLSKAVREVFVRLHEQGLIYRGTYITNWCTKCHTALSDLEVIGKERKGHLWKVRYVVDGGVHHGKELVIATTRPETLLGDSAVAVHPEDERYRHLIGQYVKLPLVGRLIPVIADEYVDRTFGTGALKVTPAHDFNDYDLGKKHQLHFFHVLTKAGKVSDDVSEYGGLSLSQAREKVVADLEAQGHLMGIENHAHTVGTCERCETVVEPLVSEQWFVRAGVLAKPALEAVRKGQSIPLTQIDSQKDAIKILPESWTSTYYNWMENIRDWCISRQLWWGHQIPAWHCGACREVTVSRTDLDVCPRCGCKDDRFKRDEDVLDTWFSSALWPFSTLGWPERTDALKSFYPTHILETGTDILFFWVARMIMMGMHFMDGQVPFRRVYLHALVRDEKGQKMSKTKGNVIDPLVVVGQYGADAFRFTLASLAGQGRDIRLSMDRVETDRAFCNKIWNASRYVLMRLGAVEPPVNEETGEVIPGIAPAHPVEFSKLLAGYRSPEEYLKGKWSQLHPVNRWVLTQLQQATEGVSRGLEEFRLNDTATQLYQFVWGTYCDWYIEFSKELLAHHPQHADETYICLSYVLNQMLRLAHPLIPFITEEIYQTLKKTGFVCEGDAAYLMQARFPEVRPEFKDETALDEVTQWCEVISSLRNFRGENNISPKARPRVSFLADAAVSQSLGHGTGLIRALAQLEEFIPGSPGDHASDDPATGEIVTKVAKLRIPLRGLVDFSGELKRIEKELEGVRGDLAFVAKKLANPSFMERAPQELVAEQRQKQAFLEGKRQELERLHARVAPLAKSGA